MTQPWPGAALEYALTTEPARLAFPPPWAGHVPFAFWLARTLRPRTLVELGTHSGNSFFAFCQALAANPEPGAAFAVDTWAGDEHAGTYGEEIFAAVQSFNATHFAAFSTLLRTTFDAARPYFADGSIDLLHIDGLHTEDAVRHDFENWRPALSSRAVVLFHDTNVRERGFGVWRLWEDLRTRFPSFTFRHSNGLGVLGVGPDQDPALRALFDTAETTESATFRACLAARGEAFFHRIENDALRADILRRHQAAAAIEADRAALDDKAAIAGAALDDKVAIAAAAADDAIAWRDNLLRTQRELLVTKDAALASALDVAAARAAAILHRDHLITRRDDLATRLLDDVAAEQFRITEERRVRAEMQEGYEKAIAGLNQHREELARHAQSVEAAATHAVATARAETAQTVAGRYVNSFSWKLTRPIRVASRLLRNRPLHPAGPAFPEAPLALPPLSSGPVPSAAPETEIAAPDPKSLFRKEHQARLDAFLQSGARLALPRAENPAVSILLVLFNQAELTFACLRSIRETLSDAPFGIEVVIADNASSDATPDLLDRLDGATILRNDSNLHFLRATNAAARAAAGRHLLLLNNDAQLLPGSLAAALRTLESDPAIGAVGGRIILPDGTLQEAGSIIWRDGTCSGYARGRDPSIPDAMVQRDVDFCSGAFLLTRAAAWHELRGLDERFAPAYYEEVDFCVRLRESGRRIVFDPDAAIIHFEFGSSASSEDAIRLQQRNHATFAAAHAPFLARQFPASARNALAASHADTGAPRILMLEDRVPHVALGSGYPRSNRLIQELVEGGAAVTFFPMIRHRQDWATVRQALDKRVEVLIYGEAEQLRDYLVARPNHFDAILVCRPHNMRHLLDAIGPEHRLLGGATVLYDAEALFVTRDLQRLQAEGNPASPEQRHERVAAEVVLTRTADAVISVSQAEADTMERYGAKETHLLGFAVDDAPIPTAFADRGEVAFLGAIAADDFPNADAVRWFATAILPRLRAELDRPDLRLSVTGLCKAPGIQALDGDTIDLRGPAPDLAEGLAHARIMVVPSRSGAGIPLKAQQAAALGIPLVTTTLIAAQLGWTPGTDLLATDDPAEFARLAARLMTDEALWTTLRANALARVQRECSPEAFRATVRRILAAVPIVHRRPEPGPDARPEPAPAPKPAAEPQTSRPAATDWAFATPFEYNPARPAPGAEPRIAVVCHLFHPAIAPEIRHYLANLPTAPDLFVSTDTDAKATAIRAAFAGFEAPLDLRILPNRGRDIAPKLIGFPEAHGTHDLVLHLHSKVSDHAPFLAPWRAYLFETLLGSPETVRSILEAFARLPDLGMVAPQHFEPIRRWLGWNGNFPEADALAKRMGIPLSPRTALDFPSGSMFWARPAALRPLLDLGLAATDFPEEGAQLDHTPAHAIERLFFHACQKAGLTWLKTAQPALMHDASCVAPIASPADLSRFAAEHGAVLGGPVPLATDDAPAPMLTRIAPGLATRLAARPVFG